MEDQLRSPNFLNYMAFKRRTGKTKVMWLPVTASTAIAAGTLVKFTSGLLVAATSSTAAVDQVGVLLKTIASTDTDYATSGRLVPVEVPIELWTEWEADFTATLLTTDIGANCDLTDGATVNRGANSVKNVKITRYLSATKGWVVLNFALS